MTRWGILGCGDVAEKKGGPALYKAHGSELVAVMRRDREKAEAFAHRHGAKRAYDRVDDLLADNEVDAVYIATPPHLHAEQTMAAAKAGKRVLVEKPMAMSGAECDAMIAACRDAGVSLHVAYYRRFYPKFVAARQAIRDGEIGEVLGGRLLLCAQSAGSGWRVQPEISGGGHFVDVGSHRIDMLLFLLDTDAAEIGGFAENRLRHHAAENDVAFVLRMESGPLISAGLHFHTRPSQDTLEIYGSAGTLFLDPFDGETLRICRSDKREDTRQFPNPAPVHLPFVQALVDIYNSGASSPGAEHVTGEEGAKTTRIMDAVLRSRHPAGKE